MKVTIPVTNKEYDIIDTMTRKEVREAGQLMKQFIGFEDRIAMASREEMNKIAEDVESKSPIIDAFMFKIFNRCVGISKEYFEDDMRNNEAIILFNRIYDASTTLPLEYVKQSASSLGTAGQQKTQNSK